MSFANRRQASSTHLDQRGSGENHTIARRARLFLKVSAAAVLVSAFMCTLFPGQWLMQMQFLTNAGITVDDVAKMSPILSMFMISSFAGKMTAILNGDRAIRTFCRWNLCATGCLVGLSLRYRDLQSITIWSFFFACYAYFGFVGDSSHSSHE